MRNSESHELTRYCYHSHTTDEWLDHISTSHLVNDPLKTEQYSDALLVPDGGRFHGFAGGVFDSDGQPVKISFQRQGLCTAADLYKSLQLTDIKEIDDEVVYLGQYRNQWGSFLVDSISRLWYTIQHPEKMKYVFLATQKDLGGIHPNAWKFLNALGIQREQVLYLTEPVRVKKVTIPEMAYVPTGTMAVNQGEVIPRYHREYLDVIYKVVDTITPPSCVSHEKVYFSRSKFTLKSKTDFGEQFITDLMQANGYYIVYPEEHTLEEQIFYVNTCKVFASIGGSCAHNIIFSKTKPKMILFNRMNGCQWHQWMLDEMAGVEPITYVDMYCEPYKAVFSTTISGPYLYLPNKNVRQFAKDHSLVIPPVCNNRLTMFKTIFRYTIQVLRTAASKCVHTTCR